MADKAVTIALLGAECTGKSGLAQALASSLLQRLQPKRVEPQATALRIAVVDEYLRTWCEQHQRTPRPSEQAHIAAEQQLRIEAAARAHDIVVCDTTPLMTAVYSLHYFGDSSLLNPAVAAQRQHNLSLLLAPDVPWQADGWQRDGEAVRARVDALLRQVLMAHQLPFVEVSCLGEQRLAQAMAQAKTQLRNADL